MEPIYVTQDSEIGLLEGLYIKERTPEAPVAGVQLNTGGVGSQALKGPGLTPIFISSNQRLVDVFGPRDLSGGQSAITNDLWKFALDKPLGGFWVVRAQPSDGYAATIDLDDDSDPVLQVDASSFGVWGNDISVDVQDASDEEENHFNLVVNWAGKQWIYKNVDISGAGIDNTLALVGDDPARPITLTKLDNGRPDNASDVALENGSDGTLVDGDFTGSNKVLELLANQKGVRWVASTRMNAAVKGKLATLAANSSDRVFLCSTDTGSVISAASAISEASTLRGGGDRLFYCFRRAYVQDPQTGTNFLQTPDAFMASVISQTDPDTHVGSIEASEASLGGVKGLEDPALSREDYKLLRAAGICALEFDPDTGPAFVSGRTLSLQPGKEEIARRRCTDYLQLGLASFLRFFVKSKNTPTKRNAMHSATAAWLQDLQNAERIVEEFSVDGESLNTPSQRALGIEKMLVSVRLFGHMLSLVVETNIGTGVVIVRQA